MSGYPPYPDGQPQVKTPSQGMGPGGAHPPSGRTLPPSVYASGLQPMPHGTGPQHLLKSGSTAANASTAGGGSGFTGQTGPVSAGGASPPPNYRIVRHLASGGMGDVFEAIHENLDRRVALKASRADFIDNPQNLQRLVQEAKATAGFDHPNVVRVFDCFLWEGRAFLAMEYLDGLTLDEILKGDPEALPEEYRRCLAEKGKLTLTWTLQLGMQIGRALTYIHLKGFVHRDLKPSNIFLTREGLFKLLDFGIVRDQRGGTMTNTGVVVGTPPYMSPEQVQNFPLDARSDLYSFGCVVFHAHTGSTPFQAPSQVQLCFQHMYAEPPDPAKLTSGTPPELRGIILRLLNKKPSDRFQNAVEMTEYFQGLAMETSSLGSGVRRRKKGGLLAPFLVTVIGVSLGLGVFGTRQFFPGWIRAARGHQYGQWIPASWETYAEKIAAAKPSIVAPDPTPAVVTPSTPTPEPTPTPSPTPTPTPTPTPEPARLPDIRAAADSPLAQSAVLFAEWLNAGIESKRAPLRWPMVMDASVDASTGQLELAVSNDGTEALAASLLVVSGEARAFSLNPEKDWEPVTQRLDLAGRGAKADRSGAFAVGALTLPPGALTPMPLGPVGIEGGAPLAVTVDLRDVRLAGLALQPTGNVVTFATSPMAKNGLKQPIALRRGVWDLEEAARAARLQPVIDVLSRPTATFPGERLPGPTPSEGADNYFAFLMRAEALAKAGRLITSDRMEIREATVDRFSGNIVLNFDIAERVDEVHVFVAEGHHALTVTISGTEERRWRSVRGVWRQGASKEVLLTDETVRANRNERYASTQELSLPIIIAYAAVPSNAAKSPLDLGSSVKRIRRQTPWIK